jgi:hypothetical protein
VLPEQEQNMEEYLSKKKLCHLCKSSSTTIHAEILPGEHIFVCEQRLETAKQNFIWICMSCGNVYIRPKSLVLSRLKDPKLRSAYEQCRGMQIIQGLDRCIECDAEGIKEFVAAEHTAKHGGHC